MSKVTALQQLKQAQTEEEDDLNFFNVPLLISFHSR